MFSKILIGVSCVLALSACAEPNIGEPSQPTTYSQPNINAYCNVVQQYSDHDAMKAHEGDLNALKSRIGVPEELQGAHETYFRGWEGKTTPLLDQDYAVILNTCKRLGWGK